MGIFGNMVQVKPYHISLQLIRALLRDCDAGNTVLRGGAECIGQQVDQRFGYKRQVLYAHTTIVLIHI